MNNVDRVAICPNCGISLFRKHSRCPSCGWNLEDVYDD